MRHTPLDYANYSRKSDMISLLTERGGEVNRTYRPYSDCIGDCIVSFCLADGDDGFDF